MIRRGNVEKQQLWEERLSRFHSSGLTIARFCQQENVAVHLFQYWSRRLRTKGNHDREPIVSHQKDVRSAGHRANVSHDSRTRLARDAEPMVQFRFDAGLHFSIPATCLDAIRCVVHSVAQGSTRTDSFQQVVVRNATREVR